MVPMFKRGCAALVVMLVSACGGNSTSTVPTTPTPSATGTSSVSVNCLTTTLTTAGQQTQCSAVALLSNGTSQDQTLASQWSSSNASVASVSATGAVTAVSSGSVTIAATFQGLQGARAVAVTLPDSFTLTGTLTDGTSHGILPNITVQIISGTNAGKSAVTDSSGNYTMSGLSAGTFTLSVSAASYQTTTQTVTLTANARVDLVLQRAASPLSYAGTWTGQFGISACNDIDPPGLTHIGLCASLLRGPYAYLLTLSQNGATVTGTYQLKSPFFSCACGGIYGTFDMSGAVATDGTLVISGTGSLTGSGVEAATTFTVRQANSSTLTGTVSGSLTFGGVQRATLGGAIH